MSKLCFKNGRVISRTNRGHNELSYTRPGEPIPNNARRVGTKRIKKAGTGGGKSRGLHGGNGGWWRKSKIASLNKHDMMKKQSA